MKHESIFRQSIARRSKHLLLALSLGALPSAIGCAAPSGDANEANSDQTSQAQWAPGNPVGTWKFQGFAGKCLDVGGWPTRNGAPVILYTCNGTAAQVITVAPANDARTEFEIRADGRCLTIGGPLVAETPIVLSQCDDSRAQRFVVDQFEGPRFKAADNTNLLVSVADTTGNNRTPIRLEGWRSTQYPLSNDTQAWTLTQIDTSPYTSTTPAVARGTVAFVGLGNKCLDIGGAPYPTTRDAILYDCNGTAAQRFDVVPVAGTRSDVELHAAGRCLEVIGNGSITTLPIGAAAKTAVVGSSAGDSAIGATQAAGVVAVSPIIGGGIFTGNPYTAGADVALTACAGKVTQRFGIETFDATYVFPSGHPEVAIGVRGAVTANHTPIEVQSRSSATADQWRVVQAEGAGYEPLLPKFSVGRAQQRDHRGGVDVTITVPEITIVDQSRTETRLSLLYRRLGTGAFTELLSSGTLGDIGQVRIATLPFPKNDAYEVKVHAENASGFAESVPFTVDTRTPISPFDVTVSDIKTDQVTLTWHAPTAPYVDDFNINWTHGSSMNVASAGYGSQDAIYSLTITGLQSNTQYMFGVQAHNVLWGNSDYTGFSANIVTPSSDNGGGGGGGLTPPMYICGTGISDCPAGFHPATYLSSTACGDPTYKNETQCNANAGPSFTACGLPNCPVGYHPIRFDYSLGCDLQTNTGVLDPNSSTCAPDNADFTMCGTCPYGYSTTGQSSNSSCDGYMQSHCHQN